MIGCTAQNKCIIALACFTWAAYPPQLARVCSPGHERSVPVPKHAIACLIK